jgi:tol-pal system protein YbgF
MGLMKPVIALALAFGLSATPLAAQSQAETLADIRQELTVLYVEIQRLKGELNTTQGASGSGGTGSLLDRVNAIEAQLAHLTNKTEELQFRIDQVVKDGTNRVGDLEFRLCELEADCDISSLGETPTLGGGAFPEVATPTTPGLPLDPAAPATGQLAVAEQADFDAAVSALEEGRSEQAAELFAAFLENYPGGPMSGEANYLRGEALAELGLVADAARAYLASYSGSPQGARAPDALLKLGIALGQLGQVSEACVTLGEVANRFPAAPAVAEAAQARASLGCP